MRLFMARRTFKCGLVGAVLVTLIPLASIPAWAAPPVVDDFEKPVVDEGIWWLGQIRPKRFWIDRRVTRKGRGALAIRVEKEDSDCYGLCQRNEIRIAPDIRLRFGEEAWYGFSFKIAGEFSEHNSRRWIIGQWKQDTNGSPFLAQRYDNGVFHITVQDNDCRIIVAQANGHPDGLHAHRANVRYSAQSFLSEPHLYDCDSDIRIEHGEEPPILPDPREQWVDMVYRVRGGRNGQGLIEIWANGIFIARVRGSIGYDDTTERTQYFKIGHYRDPIAAATILYFDDFRRGNNRTEIEFR
jgi:Polysaccharide lyase